MEYSKLADDIADLSFHLYNHLPKTGKPKDDKSEWTLLACVIQKNANGSFKVVSLGTGSKCIGRSKLSPFGDLLNDCHAEVVARRGFLRYIYDKIKEIKTTGASDIFVSDSKTDGKYHLLPNTEFYLFSSHVPCGDASIIPKDDDDRSYSVDDNIGNIMINKDSLKRKISTVEETSIKMIACKKMCEETKRNEMALSSNNGKINIQEPEKSNPVCNKSCFDEKSSEKLGNDEQSKIMLKDIHRTGAKCVPVDSRQDLHLPGTDYHTTGAVRTKPGRGDPTLSVSCSDKLARWNAVGIQGALLSHLIESPIFLSTIIIGAGGPYSLETMFRAIVDRFDSNDVYRPTILRSSKIFMHSRYLTSARNRPAPSSLVWSAVVNRPLEIAVDGRKQGATRKSKNSCLLTSRKCLFETFISLTGEKFRSQSYFQCKQSAIEYQKLWMRRKAQLGAWTEKPSHLQDFKVYDSS